jgi:hypothetical protein
VTERRLARAIPSRLAALVALVGLWWATDAVLDRQPLHLLLHALWPSSWLREGWYDVVRNTVYCADHILALARHGAMADLTLGTAAVLIGRMLARSRVRAGLPDPLEGARAWVDGHANATRRVLTVPGRLWAAAVVGLVAIDVARWDPYGNYASLDAALRRAVFLSHASVLGLVTCLILPIAFAIDAVSWRGLRALLSPVPRHDGEVGVPSDRRVAFDAVAITPETRAALFAMAALQVAAVIAVASVKLSGGIALATLLGTSAAALCALFAFRRASRVSVGVDGIFITGSSRSRFFSYRDVDGVRACGAEVQLLDGERVVLRLQLHGEDATQKDVVVARIAEAVRTAKEQATAAAGALVAAAPEERLLRLAAGGEGYRIASVSSAQLWAIVEGPEHEATTRAAAARAVLASGRVEENARVRAAARRVAQPEARHLLRELVGEDGEDADTRPEGRGEAREGRATR